MVGFCFLLILIFSFSIFFRRSDLDLVEMERLMLRMLYALKSDNINAHRFAHSLHGMENGHYGGNLPWIFLIEMRLSFWGSFLSTSF